MDYTIEKYPESAMAWYVLGWWYFLNANDVEAAKPVFKKALALDPLHARIVEGSLAFFQIAADEEMVAMLYQRLAQISPEKGSDQVLGKVDAAAKISAIVNEFFRTADESILDAVSGITESPEISMLDPFLAQRLLLAVSQLKEDKQNLAADAENLLSKSRNVAATEIDPQAVLQRLLLSGELLTLYQFQGDNGKSEQIARLILELSKDLSVPPEYEASADAVKVRAFAALGQQAEALELVDKLLDGRSNIYNFFGIAGYYALAAFDPGRAAAMALEEKESFPGWYGPDIFAAFHLDFRSIIVHPEMQAYYVEEGKWLNYLAARVPEYAKYGGN